MSWPPFAIALGAIALILVARKMRDPAPKKLLPLAAGVLFLCCWQLKAESDRFELRDKDGTLVRMIEIMPTPWSTLVGME